MEGMYVRSIHLNDKAILRRYPELLGALHHLSRSASDMTHSSKNLSELSRKVEAVVQPIAPLFSQVLDLHGEEVFDGVIPTEVFIQLSYRVEPSLH